MSVVSPPADINAVRGRLKDQNSAAPFIPDDDVDDAIQSAVTGEYSNHRPRDVVVDLTGDGGSYYRLDNLTDWVSEFSDILSVEWPVVDVATEEDPPTLLETNFDFRVHRTTDRYYLYLVGRSPAVGEAIRITMTSPHTLNSATDTIYAQDRAAVLDLAASIACLYASARTTHSHDGALRNTGVRYESASKRWMELSDQWRKRYLKHMGIKDDAVLAASAIAEWDAEPSSGIPWLTHGRRPRRFY